MIRRPPRSTLFPTRRSSDLSSVTQSCSTLCDPMDGGSPGLPVHHQLLESIKSIFHFWFFPSFFFSSLPVYDGQGGLACYDSWGHKESDTTEWLNWTEWLPEDAFTNSCEKKGSKKQSRKGKIYPFECRGRIQRIARRDKKAFLSDQCKEIEENNRMGKTRDLFKKIRDFKGTFHAKMDTLKERNAMDLTVAEDIKKKWQQYTEELY